MRPKCFSENTIMAVDHHREEALLFRSQFFAGGVSKTTYSDEKGFTHKPCDSESISRSLFSHESEFAYSGTETEEDNEYIADLTRQMAHYMFLDDDTERTNKSWGFPGKTNANVRSPLGSNHGNNRDGSSLELSNVIENERSCSNNIANGIVGKFETVNPNDEKPEYPKLRQFQTFSPEPTLTSLSSENPSFGFRSNQPLPYNQIKALQFNRMKQVQVLKQNRVQTFQKKDKTCSESVNGVGGVRSFGCSSSLSNSMPWTNQKVTSPGTKDIFLNGSGPIIGSSSSGTGVFLPCVIGGNTQSQKKRGCSPVLIPAKVLQALKVHFDRMGYSTTPNTTAGFSSQFDANNGEKSGIHSQKKRQSRTVPATKCKIEMDLPQEWTY